MVAEVVVTVIVGPELIGITVFGKQRVMKLRVGVVMIEPAALVAMTR